MAHFYLHRSEVDFLVKPKHRASFDGLENVYSADEIIEELEANLWLETVVFGDQALEGALGLWGRDLKRLSLHFGFSEIVVQKAIARRIKNKGWE